MDWFKTKEASGYNGIELWIRLQAEDQLIREITETRIKIKVTDFKNASYRLMSGEYQGTRLQINIRVSGRLVSGSSQHNHL